MNAISLVADLRSRGFTLAVVAGSLRVTPKSALTRRDYEVIRADVAGLIAALSPSEPWDELEALLLMTEADALAARLSVSGVDSQVAAAAAMVASAYAARDLETIRFACLEFGVVVRGLAARSRREAVVSRR